MTGTKLKALPARLETWANCKKRVPAGKVLSTDGRFAYMETYCCNPYGGYDTSQISRGRDVGSVSATKLGPDRLIDVPYFVDFAFVYTSSFWTGRST